jgi:hypothetical protein
MQKDIRILEAEVARIDTRTADVKAHLKQRDNQESNAALRRAQAAELAAQEAPGDQLAPAFIPKVNEKVETLYHGEWYEGLVLRLNVRGSSCSLRYPGDVADESGVAFSSLRPFGDGEKKLSELVGVSFSFGNQAGTVTSLNENGDEEWTFLVTLAAGGTATYGFAKVRSLLACSRVAAAAPAAPAVPANDADADVTKATLKGEVKALKKLKEILLPLLEQVKAELEEVPTTTADCRPRVHSVIKPALEYWVNISTGVRKGRGYDARIAKDVAAFTAMGIFYPPRLMVRTEAKIRSDVDTIYEEYPQLATKCDLDKTMMVEGLIFARGISQEEGEYHGKMAAIVSDHGGLKALHAVIARSYKKPHVSISEDTDADQLAIGARAYLSVEWWARILTDSKALVRSKFKAKTSALLHIQKCLTVAARGAIQVGVALN